ncbi:DUF6294 family protein [Amycolatopsis sp. MtRt-6]|uniref:DUF6294 family protein n=1 Tax=Amycolatopsis sp. MtRt-6 TaxID=2792782 RepID=UPI001A8D5E0B|nr:DUF6294 family protein [Amycolatopsis sp. MtRt-6]
MRLVNWVKSAAVALAVLSGGVAVAAPASATTTGITFRTANDLHAGDCTLFHGATWVLNPDGTASFDGTVTSSDDNDAWLMWAHVLDRNGAEIGLVGNSFPNTPDPNKFAQNMPDSSRQYRFLATGHFPASWYGLIGKLRLEYRC